MQKYQNWLIAGFMIVFVMQLRVAKLSSSVANKIQIALAEKNESYSKQLQILKTLRDCSIMENYSVEGYVGSGQGTAVVDVTQIDTGLKYVAKVVLDIDNSYSRCRKEEIIEKLSNDGISYVNKFIQKKRFTDRIQTEDFYSCVLILEKAGEALDKNLLFPKFDGKSKIEIQNTKIENSKKLVRFFGRVIQSFAELHVKAKVLHGDIRPENIMVNKKEISKDNFDLIPVIIDFGLRLVNKSGKDIKNDLLRYTKGYRLPQMIEKIKVDGKSFEESWEDNSNEYIFSKDFIEDVYALGKTIENVLKFQTNFIDNDICEMLRLKDLYLQMMQKKEGANKKQYISKEDPIPNMQQVLTNFLDKMKRCVEIERKNKSLRYVPDEVNEEFIKQASKSLESLRSKVPII